MALARIPFGAGHPVTLEPGWVGDGATDNTDLLDDLVADELNILPAGTFNVGSGVIAQPMEAQGGILAPAGVLDIDAPFGAPYVQTGSRVFDYSRGGYVRFLGKSGATLSGRYFGVHPGRGEGAAAVETAAALNLMFRSHRDSVTQVDPSLKVILQIDPGTYHIDDSIWAGYSTGGQHRRYILNAEGAAFIATEGLGGRVVWDMTGVGAQEYARARGLEIRTKTGMAFEDCPAIGLMFARAVVTGSPVNSSRAILEFPRIEGDFQIACFYNMCCEETLVIRPSCKNDATLGRYTYVITQTNKDFDGIGGYFRVESEFATLAEKSSNQQQMFIAPRASTNYTGDPDDGAAWLFVNPNNALIQWGYTNKGSAGADIALIECPAMRIVYDPYQTVSPKGQKPNSFLCDSHKFHRKWDTIIDMPARLDGGPNVATDISLIRPRLRLRESTGANQLPAGPGAIFRLGEGATIDALRIVCPVAQFVASSDDEGDEGGVSAEGAALTVDGTAANVDVTGSHIEAVWPSTISRKFSGRIICPSDAPPTFDTPAQVNAIIEHHDTAQVKLVKAGVETELGV